MGHKAITVFVVDDHTLVRQGMVHLLNLEEDLTVVGDGTGSVETSDAIRRAKPQVVTVDLEMPEIRGAELIGMIRSAHPAAGVLVCTMHAHYAFVAEALRCGAGGYVLKSSPSALLLEGIRRVARGEGLIDPALQTDVIKHLQTPAGQAASGELTVKEIEALRLAADGLSNQEIAKRTGQSVETVKLRLRRTFQKLGAADRVNAVAVAMRRHLIS
jgi:DNA-binding NarL/FixJ family response regulator